MKRFFKQVGQGMTEYIIIVALIAIAAIAVYSFFGDTLRSQMGAMTQELSGQSGSDATSDAQSAADATEGEREHRGLGDFTGGADASVE